MGVGDLESKIKILTITGHSGSGKTSFVDLIMKEVQGVSWYRLPTYTTRPSRQHEAKGECEFVSLGDFEQMEICGEFLWTVSQYGGIQYGTRKEDLESALEGNDVAIMVLVPEKMQGLRQYILDREGDEDKVLSIFFEACYQIRLQRLFVRGANNEEIAKRVRSEAGWYKTVGQDSRFCEILNEVEGIENTLKRFKILWKRYNK